MNVLKLAVMEGDISPIIFNVHLLSQKNEYELFLDACAEDKLNIVEYFVERRNILGIDDLVPSDEFFEDFDGIGYTGYVGMSIAAKKKALSVLKYLVRMSNTIDYKADYPSALYMSVVNSDYDTFSFLWSNGMRDFRDRALKESIRTDDFRFFKILYPKNGCTFSEESYLFHLAIANENLPVSFFLHELYELTPESDTEFYPKFMTYKKIILRTRTRAANKIRNWWGPLLRRINPEFSLREGEESWKRIQNELYFSIN
ncbi:hypothetical protein EBS02_11760 [bacterium]|nr:hypothetical protein [bacterium]